MASMRVDLIGVYFRGDHEDNSPFSTRGWQNMGPDSYNIEVDSNQRSKTIALKLFKYAGGGYYDCSYQAIVQLLPGDVSVAVTINGQIYDDGNNQQHSTCSETLILSQAGLPGTNFKVPNDDQGMEYHNGYRNGPTWLQGTAILTIS